MNFRLLYAIACFLLICKTVTSTGQTIVGTVSDKQSSLPLPYASLGIRGKNIGCVADKKGQFSLDVSKAGNRDSVIISNVGYESTVILVKDFARNGTNQIKLQPKTKQLAEVIVIAKQDLLVLGNATYNSDFTGWGDFWSSRGRSRGLQIEPGEFPVKITEFDVRLKDNDFDSVKLRLHIYTHNPNSDSAEEALPESVFFTAVKNQHWVNVDLDKYNIRISRTLWVSVEWVDSWTSPKSSKGSYLLTISTGKKEGLSFYRDTPEQLFVVQSYKTSPAMCFKGYKVKAE